MDSTRAATELFRPTWHRFLSPHYDDIALSCGGTVALLDRAGLSPEVAIIFGEAPNPAAPLSDFAAMQHRRWGLDAGAAVAGRRREEAAAAAALGTTVTILPFTDAIYRESHYDTEEALFGAPVAAEARLPAAIVAALGLDRLPDPAVRLYAPLAVAGHVDHRHAFAAGAALGRAGWDVWFYEDVPYAMLGDHLDARIEHLGDGVAPAALINVDDTWETKIVAIMAYPSQLPTIFRAFGAPDAARISEAMGAYARSLGAGERVERFWRLSDWTKTVTE